MMFQEADVEELTNLQAVPCLEKFEELRRVLDGSEAKREAGEQSLKRRG
jgi:hypothetical protein